MNKEPSPTPPEDTVTLTVGTAGHIDHGKTELIKYLTGCNTDRLPEEKARGMTIDLGFATCVLPNHRRVGIVDVPGHEKFIHNMVAGAAGIDAVLLVVAADDGVMPQTLEHFHIVRLLGIESGMIAITKTDIVSSRRLRTVLEQVGDLVAGTFLEGCRIVPFSSKTGEGFQELYDAFVSTVDKTAKRDSSGAFRLHVERSFVLQGIGVVVSGIPRSGRVREGDVLELLPGGEKKRVRGIQVYGHKAEEGRAGECVALNMCDTSKEEGRRGAVLATPGYFTPTRFINAKFRLLPELEKPVAPRTAIRFHVGTTDAPGHLVLPDLVPLSPGSDSYVQIQLKRPVVAAPGDFFVLRLLTPVRTIGGGYVVAPERMRMRRSRGDWKANCEVQEKAFQSPGSAVNHVLRQAGPESVSLGEIARRAFVNPEAARKVLGALITGGDAVELPGNRFVLREAVKAARDEITSCLEGLHDGKPLSVGFPGKLLSPLLTSDKLLVELALLELANEGIVGKGPAGYALCSRTPELTEKQQRVAAAIESIYTETAFASPRIDELPALLGMPAQLLEPVLDHLFQIGQLVAIDARVVLHRKHVDDSRLQLTRHIEKHGSMEAGEFKALLGTTRKFAIPLLEYWDKQNLTRRDGNKRTLKGTRTT